MQNNTQEQGLYPSRKTSPRDLISKYNYKRLSVQETHQWLRTVIELASRAIEDHETSSELLQRVEQRWQSYVEDPQKMWDNLEKIIAPSLSDDSAHGGVGSATLFNSVVALVKAPLQHYKQNNNVVMLTPYHVKRLAGMCEDQGVDCVWIYSIGQAKKQTADLNGLFSGL